ncbi:hypothetical protein [uncultured Phenylobacterium sp.]|uniref:hypothetical protein n=1 Tax=uncultured Phenylobacterium sp. TaxID=349273 RepID=UPI0025D8DEE2|nr:hypothetical protein [uncultured Phenylobacterium sp.]
MTDLRETLSRYRLPLRRDHLKHAQHLTGPAMRYASRNPMLMIGAGLLALAGVLAFTNRRKIASTAGPLIEDARVRGQALMEEAAVKSHALMGEATAKTHELLETARAKGEAVAEKVSSVRRGAAGRAAPNDVH